MAQGQLGSDVDRVDGRLKVTGQARYAAEAPLAGVCHAAFVGSAIAHGRVTQIDTQDAEEAEGVLLVLTHGNRGPLGPLPEAEVEGGTAEPRLALADDRVWYHGQVVAMVVAETPEQAAFAASRIRVSYDAEPFVTRIDDARAPRFPGGDQFGESLDASRGLDPDVALAGAPVRVDATYISPNEHPCAMEPHATTASWIEDRLVVYDATQGVMWDRAVIASVLQLPADRVRVLAPFVGGMFGSKVTTGPHTILACIATMRLGRPVKAVLRRQQVLTGVGHRTETIQRLELGAERDGRLVAMRHRTTCHIAADSGIPDRSVFVEPTSLTSRMLYACPTYACAHELVRLNVMKPNWMRAPGEASGTWALESAMDELAVAARIDPVELRRRNHTTIHPHTGKPFSSKHLLECYDRGASRFGWERRDPRPRSMRDGEAFLGWGMATATYPGWRMGATVRVRLVAAEGAGVRAFVETAGAEVGTDMYTSLTLVTANGLGLPLDRVTARLGDTDLPDCAMAGGSHLTASTAPAIDTACAVIRSELLGLAETLSGAYALATRRPNEFVFADGRITPIADPSHALSFEDVLRRTGRAELSAEAKTDPRNLCDDRTCFQSFGCHFVEVRVHPDIGRVRVTRVVTVVDVGRVLSARAVRNQLIGAVVFGIGQALMEELVYDDVHGQPINADLAGYLVPVHADIPDIDVSWIDAPDPAFNTMGVRGAGEIGITGTAAAVANAVWHATGVRVRQLPILPERLL